MKFSIIIPSFNQPKYIEHTLKNVILLKELAKTKGYSIEILLFDNCSDSNVQAIINRNYSEIDYIEIKKDKGQYDAINKGIEKATGDYWTWLNTDDLIDVNGFCKLADVLINNQKIDYIYGNIRIQDEAGNIIKTIKATNLTLDKLVSTNAGVYQPGSFFKKQFTDKIGNLAGYECCFDYEYILRMLKASATFYRCNWVVADFRYYSSSKSGNIVNKFIEEQVKISKIYGRKWNSWLSLELYARKIKRKIII